MQDVEAAKLLGVDFDTVMQRLVEAKLKGLTPVRLILPTPRVRVFDLPVVFADVEGIVLQVEQKPVTPVDEAIN